MNSEVSTPAGEESFAALFEASLQDRTEVREGEVVKGTIIEVREDNVLVDIGYKSEATIALLNSAWWKVSTASVSVTP